MHLFMLRANYMPYATRHAKNVKPQARSGEPVTIETGTSSRLVDNIQRFTCRSLLRRLIFCITTQ